MIHVALALLSTLGLVRGRGVAGPVIRVEYAVESSKANVADELYAICFRRGGNQLSEISYGKTTCNEDDNGWICETPGSASCFRTD